MDIGIALISLVIVILVIRPLVQRQRENQLAEKLKNVHDPVEASIIMDAALQAGRDERDFFTRIRQSYFFWL